jgi:hypothetical protein
LELRVLILYYDSPDSESSGIPKFSLSGNATTVELTILKGSITYRTVMEKTSTRMNKTVAVICLLIALVSANCGGAGSERPSDAGGPQATSHGPASGPLPDEAFKAEITTPQLSTKMLRGEKTTIVVKVKNVSSVTWPYHGRPTDGYYQVNLGNIWYDNQNKLISNHPYVRSGLPNDVQPGQQVEVPLTITAPNKSGDYTLRIDLVQEMVCWFSDKGSRAVDTKVRVE